MLLPRKYSFIVFPPITTKQLKAAKAKSYGKAISAINVVSMQGMFMFKGKLHIGDGYLLIRVIAPVIKVKRQRRKAKKRKEAKNR